MCPGHGNEASYSVMQQGNVMMIQFPMIPTYYPVGLPPNIIGSWPQQQFVPAPPNSFCDYTQPRGIYEPDRIEEPVYVESSIMNQAQNEDLGFVYPAGPNFEEDRFYDDVQIQDEGQPIEEEDSFYAEEPQQQEPFHGQFPTGNRRHRRRGGARKRPQARPRVAGNVDAPLPPGRVLPLHVNLEHCLQGPAMTSWDKPINSMDPGAYLLSLVQGPAMPPVQVPASVPQEQKRRVSFAAKPAIVEDADAAIFAYMKAHDPTSLVDEAESCELFCQRIQANKDTAPKQRAFCLEVIRWLSQPGAIFKLSTDRSGCRVVQEALATASAPDGGQAMMLKELKPYVIELYKCQNGNHVLQKAIEQFPPKTFGEELVVSLIEHNIVEVATHRFGCRILERLIEHCPAATAVMIKTKVIHAAEVLCKHKFGNFVMQHLLEHGPPDVRSDIIAKLLPAMPELAMHRSASHVVQVAMGHNDDKELDIVRSIFSRLDKVATNRYGSYVVESVEQLNIYKVPGPWRSWILSQLMAKKKELDVADGPGQKVLIAFGIQCDSLSENSQSTRCDETDP